MYEFTNKQIKEYVEIAKLHGISWACND